MIKLDYYGRIFKEPTFEEKMQFGEEDFYWEHSFYFDPTQWYCSDRASENYLDIPICSGIYLLVTHTDLPAIIYRVQYVGQAINLKKRIGSHQTLKLLRQFLKNVKIYFRKYPIHQLNTTEKHLIAYIDPPLNQTYKLVQPLEVS